MDYGIKSGNDNTVILNLPLKKYKESLMTLNNFKSEKTFHLSKSCQSSLFPTPDRTSLKRIKMNTHIPDCILLPMKTGGGQAGEREYWGDI